VFEFLIEDPTAQTVAVYAADAKGQKESLGQSTLRFAVSFFPILILLWRDGFFVLFLKIFTTRLGPK